MTRTSKSLCSLDYEDEEDPHLKTIVSSPCDSSDHMNIITPGSSPVKETTDGGTRLVNRSREAAVSESEEDLSDCESTIFPIDCEELDLEEIENN